MHLAFLTQVVDADHPALAQTNDLIAALARRCERVTVVCDRVGRHALPANVDLRTFGSRSRVGRGLRFERALAAAVAARVGPDAVLAHMVPLFAILAAPLARARRIPLALWYTHWNADRALRLGLRLADVVLSVDVASFPLPTPKLYATGHAIDVERFRPRDVAASDGGPLRLLSLGRTARWKGNDTLLEGFSLARSLGLDAVLEIRGPSLTPDEEAHRRELEDICANTPALAGRVRIEGAVARDRIPDLLAGGDLVVSATQPAGGATTLDKVVYEAAACEVPVLSSNNALVAFLGGLPVELTFAPGDAAGLADRLLAFAAASASDRAAAGRELRRRVERDHSLEAWAERVVSVLARLRRPGVECVSP